MEEDRLIPLELRLGTLEDSLGALERVVERMREEMRMLAATIGPATGPEQL